MNLYLWCLCPAPVNSEGLISHLNTAAFVLLIKPLSQVICHKCHWLGVERGAINTVIFGFGKVMLSLKFSFFLFFLVRKIHPELTFVAHLSLSLFAPSTKPQCTVVYPSCKSFWFFYVRCHHSMAWWAVHRSLLRIWTGESRAAKAKYANLTIWPQGQPL